MAAGGFRTWGPRHRRGSGGSGGVFSSEDDTTPDNHSQASGGSSEASGGAGNVPAGDADGSQGNTKLPQYGLRNTVDLGGAAQKLEQSERNQRSWSAPPDARTSEPAQPKRFVSRIEIQPKMPGNPNVQQCTQQQQPPSPPIYSSSPGKPPMVPKPTDKKPSSNVRHIPIFVEGRDEPVLPKDVTDDPKPVPPTAAHGPVYPEDFTAEFPTNPHFVDSPFTERVFTDHPFADKFSRPQFSNVFQQPHYGTPPQQHSFRQQGFPHSQQQQFSTSHQQQPVPPQKRPTASQAPPTKRPTDAPAPAKTASPPPPPPPPVANDPLSKVAAVQKNVDSLTEQVSQFTGSSRSDKQYIYLDEMLTRNLIQLDDIDTQGKEEIRQARKDTIRSIQRAISLLESKAPLPDTTKTDNMDISVESEPLPGETDCNNGCNNGCTNGCNNDCNKESMDTQEAPSDISKDNAEQPANVEPQSTTQNVETTESAENSGEQLNSDVKCSSENAEKQEKPANSEGISTETEENLGPAVAAANPCANENSDNSAVLVNTETGQTGGPSESA
jgi:BCL2-associated athanogene 3